MATNQAPWVVRATAALVVLTLCTGLYALPWLRPWVTLSVLGGAVLVAPLAALGLYPRWWRRRAPLPDAASDLERRRPVWSALSELYLDTELQGVDHARIAATLHESGYSVDQLEQILYCELHPVLIGNLVGGLGEWAHFDGAWLEQRVLARAPGPRRLALVFGTHFVEQEWHSIRARLSRR
jgi:hypothetical protein